MLSLAPDQILPFVRKKEYQFVRQLNHGGCGITVLLRDDVIGEQLVCKKYQPLKEAHRDILFTNFLREIKLLHRVFHTNVVRIFNYYVYPEEFSGFILMEFVDGVLLREYLEKHPERINEIFMQAVDGFAHLESKGVLHRDIRDGNIMVTNEGIVKIIDLGFGKSVEVQGDFKNSIVLNWDFESPAEFTKNIYDFGTEVYFVGNLFKSIIEDFNIEGFRYKSILTRMVKRDPSERLQRFADVAREIRSGDYKRISFTAEEKEAYRWFADSFCGLVPDIDPSCSYSNDINKILVELERIYTSAMLEENLQNPADIPRVFLMGRWSYYTKVKFAVETLGGFLELLRSSSFDKQNMIIANLQKRLDGIKRSVPKADEEDDIPF